MKNNTICQSCGMPLSKDPMKGGSNTDGSKNNTYCSYCYQEGKFIYTGNDVNEFQEYCRTKMIENGSPKLMAWLFTRGMKRLKRWQA